MTIVDPSRAPARTEDVAAIAELENAVERQRHAFRADPYPTLEERRELLHQLAAMLTTNRERIEDGLSRDFGVHPRLASDLIEILGVAERALFAAEHLNQWMASEPRAADPQMFGTARTYVLAQPKGVMGIIPPWNFPYEDAVGPLADMLAAGNRVILKPSEYAPASGRVLQELVRTTFAPDRVDVVLGGVELARAFARVEWDHLLYVGSTTIGREVAKAAAERLVPLTLELGGKCPTIFAPDSINAEAVGHLLGGKAVKNGQMCTSPDYCLVPRTSLGKFVALARDHVQRAMPGYARSENCTGIISIRHVERLQRLLDDARARGCDVVPLEAETEIDPERRQMPLTLVIDPPVDAAVLRDEVFGPILPVKAYDSLDEAIAFVNDAERPLGVYLFTRDKAIRDRLLRQTTSGGFCLNTVGAHGAVPALPFGGSGKSGYGRHHGLEGFREFSNLRAVYERGAGDALEIFTPPYGDEAESVARAAFEALRT